MFTYLRENNTCSHCVPFAAQRAFINAHARLTILWRPLTTLVLSMLTGGIALVNSGPFKVVGAFFALTFLAMTIIESKNPVSYCLVRHHLFLFKDRFGNMHCEAQLPATSNVEESRAVGRILRLDSRLFAWSGFVDTLGKPLSDHRVRLQIDNSACAIEVMPVIRFTYQDLRCTARDLRFETAMRLVDSHVSMDAHISRSLDFIATDQKLRLHEVKAADFRATISALQSALMDQRRAVVAAEQTRARASEHVYALTTELLEILGILRTFHTRTVPREVPQRIEQALNATIPPLELALILDELDPTKHPYAIRLRDDTFATRLRTRATTSLEAAAVPATLPS